MTFKHFSQFLQQIETISSRNEITVVTAEFLKEIKSEDVKILMYLMQGKLAPKYVDLEFKISRKLILRAIESYIKSNDSKIDPQELLKQSGDLGSVIEHIKVKINKENKSKELSVQEVYDQLKTIAITEGKGSVEGKIQGYINLISQLDSIGAKYSTRIILGELRLGVSDKTVLDSLSWFLKGDKSIRKLLDYAFGAKADIGELAEIVIQSKDKDIEKELSGISIQSGIPVAPKLVERESSAEAVWKRMPNCFVQPKLDGLRGEIHLLSKEQTKKERELLDINPGENKEDQEVRIFTRNLENMSDQFPEISKALRSLGVESIILDSEIIGFDSEKGKYLTYQETMQRKRKYDVDLFSASVPVKAMCFDILFLNGKDLSREPIEKRIEILREILTNNQQLTTNNSILDLLETKQMQSEQELEAYFREKVGMGLEGIITKEAESIYEPGTRNFKWIKLKANSQSELVDTLDVAVMGYYLGRGQRAKFGIGAILAGIYDPETDKYYSVGKVGSGMTEAQLEVISKDLEKYSQKEMPENFVVEKPLFPDVWVKPKIIMEIDADEITRSPNHTAARGVKSSVPKDNPERGLSIRFPRMKIWNRTDKDTPNTVAELIRMYELRKGK